MAKISHVVFDLDGLLLGKGFIKFEKARILSQICFNRL